MQSADEFAGGIKVSKISSKSKRSTFLMMPSVFINCFQIGTERGNAER